MSTLARVAAAPSTSLPEADLYAYGLRLGTHCLSDRRWKRGLKFLVQPIPYWRSLEYRLVWKHAGFNRDDRILDIGSPKLLSIYLAERVGASLGVFRRGVARADGATAACILDEQLRTLGVVDAGVAPVRPKPGPARIACGRELRAVAAGTQTREQALARSHAFSASPAGPFRWMLRVQRLVPRVHPRVLGASLRAIDRQRFIDWAFGHYLEVAHPRFAATSPHPSAQLTVTAAERHVIQELAGAPPVQEGGLHGKVEEGSGASVTWDTGESEK